MISLSLFLSMCVHLSTMPSMLLLLISHWTPHIYHTRSIGGSGHIPDGRNGNKNFCHRHTSSKSIANVWQNV